MKTILFLGDSITDCDHCFTSDNLGEGYVKMISESLPHHPETSHESWQIINGGTDGFTFPSIYRKWNQSYSSLSLDVVSVLGGINDVGLMMDSGMSESQIQCQLLNTELALKHLLSDLVRQQVPQILLIEPFLFPWPEYLGTWMRRLEQVRAIIRNTSETFVQEHLSPDSSDSNESPTVLRLISLQPALDEFAKRCGYPAVTIDGIHLTAAGHQILCDRILTEILR